jgi:hypothetical protein
MDRNTVSKVCSILRSERVSNSCFLYKRRGQKACPGAGNSIELTWMIACHGSTLQRYTHCCSTDNVGREVRFLHLRTSSSIDGKRCMLCHAICKKSWGTTDRQTTDLEPLVGLTLPAPSFSAPRPWSTSSSSFLCFFLFWPPAVMLVLFPLMFDDSAAGLANDSESSEGDECIDGRGCDWCCCEWPWLF